ncbi:MAG: methyltransferase domain-containing protein [Deltaproteobacteria bacterium]|nr:methyltransferase domain-containing protein [Deltaproteobacteria bacterium]
MSYRFYSPKTGNVQNDTQWDGRTLDGELAAFSGRSLVAVFDKYLSGRKAKIIEAGCGLGAWCEWFKRRGHDVVGLEYLEDVVKRAKSFTPGSSVVRGDVTNIDYGNGTFDAYVSLGVIEHFEDGPEKALSEAFRVLKPGGLAFITVPVLTPFRRFIAHPVRDIYFLLNKLRNRQAFFWEYRYTPDELRGYVEKAGFETLEEGFDDYERWVNDRHLGLCGDWFFLRKKSGGMWELNRAGMLCLGLLKMIFPSSWYCAGWLVVARVRK